MCVKRVVWVVGCGWIFLVWFSEFFFLLVGRVRGVVFMLVLGV